MLTRDFFSADFSTSNLYLFFRGNFFNFLSQVPSRYVIYRDPPRDVKGKTTSKFLSVFLRNFFQTEGLKKKLS